MLDVGTATAAENSAADDDDDLAVFVDRIAAAGSDRSTAGARVQVRRRIAAGEVPPGLRRLAEALAASVTERPPAPRSASEDASSVVTAMQGNPLIVLEDFDTAAVAGALAALLADGRRVVVAGSTPAELAAVRDALTPDVADRVLDRFPALSPAELRELRRLLATSTPGRRARADQRLPPTGSLPQWDEVAQLCERTARAVVPGAAATMVPALLADLPPDRRDAVVSVSRCVNRSLGALHPRRANDWTWALLSDLIYGRNRPAFDRMVEDTAQAVTAVEGTHHAAQVTFIAPLPDGSVEVLARYRDFLQSGGRARPYFRSTVQREVAPVLRLIRVDDRTPETAAEVGRVIEHLELGERLARLEAGCAEIGIPAPRGERELVELTENLLKVGAAARSVGALRHDVLFLAADSPLSVPDVDTAEQIAHAVLEYAEHGSAVEAGRVLDRIADQLASHVPASFTAPEHELAVAALRGRDLSAYATAIEALGAARRESQDESRCGALLRRLADRSPRLVRAWTAQPDDPAGLGFACLLTIDSLLTAVPVADSADAVLVLGASRLGVERLLLTAAAPRLIAAVAPDEKPAPAPSLLSVLQRSSALVIRGRPVPGGRVVHLAGAQRPSPGPHSGPAVVGQAGA